MRTVLEEDFPTGEGAQAGFMSGSGRSHIVFGRNEPALAHFETVMAAALDWRRARAPMKNQVPPACRRGRLQSR